MKARMLAVLLAATAATAPFQAADAGPLADALRSKLGTAVFLGKVAKANLKDSMRQAVRKAVDFAWDHGH